MTPDDFKTVFTTAVIALAFLIGFILGIWYDDSQAYNCKENYIDFRTKCVDKLNERQLDTGWVIDWSESNVVKNG